MNRDIMLIEEDWGCLDLNISSHRIDILPRLTVSDMSGAWVVNLGLFAFTLNLVILDRNDRALNSEIRKRRNDTFR